MAIHPGSHPQSTDGANSAAMITSRNVDGSGSPKTLIKRSIRDISGDDGASASMPRTEKPVTAPLAAGDQ